MPYHDHFGISLGLVGCNYYFVRNTYAEPDKNFLQDRNKV